MLSRLGRESEIIVQKTEMGNANFPAPFRAGLEYSSPARGMWNIVHSGMLIPESHQIFVCAYGCLRGVVLTAAEMNAMGRYSSIAIREGDVISGSIESLMIDGVSDILNKLDYKPKCLLIFISCQHFFMAYDQKTVFRKIKKQHPELEIIDCYMIPTLRKSGITPDRKMRLQMAKLLPEPETKKEKLIHVLGSNLELDCHTELISWLTEQGMELKSIHQCNTFQEYQDLCASEYNLYYDPIALDAVKHLKKQNHTEYLYFPASYDPDEITESYQKLAEKLGLQEPDFSKEKKEALKILQEAREVLKDTEVVLDYTYTFRPLSLAVLLLAQGFHLTRIYADSFLPEERVYFDWIRDHAPSVIVMGTNQPEMRFYHQDAEKKVVAIGQKAAYFSGTDYFVNVAEGGGLIGYYGIKRLAEYLIDAAMHKKDRKELIQKKGFGCESCI